MNLFCIKCQKKTANATEPKRVMTKNHRAMLKTTCKVCGTTKNRFVAK